MANITLISPFDDTKNGTNAADNFFVWGGNDTVNGLNGADFFFDQGVLGGSGGAFSGDDIFRGGNGADTFIAGDGSNILSGGSGSDTVRYSFADRAVSVNLATGLGLGEGTDSLFSIENVDGSVNNDSITGSSVANVLFGDRGRDTIDGRGGDDTLMGGVGNDTLIGGSGADTADYSYLASVGGVDVTLGEGGADGAARERDAGASSSGPVAVAAGTDILRSIEHITGSLGRDSIVGNAADNRLSGGGGADTLTGGNGADRLTGGAGGDVFVFRSTAEDKNSAGDFDVITDFVHGVDRIDFSAIDGNASRFGDQDLVFVGSGAAGLGRIHTRFDAASNITTVEVNTRLNVTGLSGDPELRLELRGDIVLTAADFIL